MKQTSSSSRYGGVRIESLRKRRRSSPNNSKIREIHVEKINSKFIERKINDTPTSLISSKHTNSATSNGDKTFPTTITSLPLEISVLNQTIDQSEVLSTTGKHTDIFTNENKYKQLKGKDQSQQCHPRSKYLLKFFSSILGILFLTAVILPSIFVYIYAPKSSQPGLSENVSIYRNHCASISSKSLWQIDTEITITMKIDTSSCSFNRTPFYFVSIAGNNNHYCLAGYGAIYQPTKESFQIYTKSTCGGWNSTTVLSYALSYEWNVNWMGFYKY